MANIQSSIEKTTMHRVRFNVRSHFIFKFFNRFLLNILLKQYLKKVFFKGHEHFYKEHLQRGELFMGDGIETRYHTTTTKK